MLAGRLRTPGLTLLSICFIFCCQLVAPVCSCAEPHVVNIPRVEDFAVNPESGDVIALLSNGPEGFIKLYRGAELTKEFPAAAKEIRPGNLTSSIVYKKYKGKSFYAVVSNEQAMMYIIDPKSFKLVKEIPIRNSIPHRGTCSLVVSSQNPNDPFLYYCTYDQYSPRQGGTGVVDIRTYENRGIVAAQTVEDREVLLGQTNYCSISADGKMLYRRGDSNKPPALKMATGFEEDKPIFKMISFPHDSPITGPIVPDHKGRFVATREAIYSADLRKRYGSLTCDPMCFIKDQPLLIENLRPDFKAAYLPSSTPDIVVFSCTTFTKTGSGIKVPVSNYQPGKNPVFDVFNKIENWDELVDDRKRSIIDMKFDRCYYLSVIYQRLVFVPMADFELPERK